MASHIPWWAGFVISHIGAVAAGYALRCIERQD